MDGTHERREVVLGGHCRHVAVELSVDTIGEGGRGGVGILFSVCKREEDSSCMYGTECRIQGEGNKLLSFVLGSAFHLQLLRYNPRYWNRFEVSSFLRGEISLFFLMKNASVPLETPVFLFFLLSGFSSLPSLVITRVADTKGLQVVNWPTSR